MSTAVGSPAPTDALRTRAFAALAEVFYPVYTTLFPQDDRFARRFDHTLRRANLSTTGDLYLSAALGLGTIVGAAAGLASLALVGFGLLVGDVTLPSVQYRWLPFVPPTLLDALSPLKVPAAILLAGALGAGLGLLGGALLALLVPVLRATERDRHIGLVFPDAVGMMYALAVGGMDQLDAVRQVADSADVYGELAVEFQRIVRQTDVFGRDYESAVEEVAASTPNAALARFLTDLLSVTNAGGDFLTFLTETMTDQRRARRRDQESRLRWLETLGQVYINLQIAPMLIVIVLVIMAMVGDPQLGLLVGVVYGIEPGLNLFYLLVVGTVTVDEPGDGYMRLGAATPKNVPAAESLALGPIEDYLGAGPLFAQIRRHEAVHRVRSVLAHPLTYLRANPVATFAVTVPLALVVELGLLLTGTVSLAPQAFVDAPLRQTLLLAFLPFYLTLVPYVVLYEWSRRSRGRITDTLAGDLRKLANTNQTGQPLHESMRITARDTGTRFGAELGTVYTKLKLGIPLDRALIEFNNRYHLPRLARMVAIIEKAQDVSSEITEVLQTAADVADTHHELELERHARTAMQVVVVEMTFLVFLGILAGMELYLIEKVIEIIGPDPAWPNFDNVDPRLLKVIFFHAAVIQGVSSGLVAGYVQSGDLRSGAKFALLNGTFALGVWLSIAAA